MTELIGVTKEEWNKMSLNIIRTVEAGFESKFPMCCIMFFCTTWESLRRDKSMFYGGNAPWFEDPINSGRIYCINCGLRELQKID